MSYNGHNTYQLQKKKSASQHWEVTEEGELFEDRRC
jgi:hypothetical protein